MFYQVRIKRADGTVKKVVSEKKLNRIHWENFQKSEEEIGLVTASKQQVPTWVKQKLDLEYMETYSDLMNYNG
jgi:Holliday junction resolvasome RuvABC endonuclease subunit